MAGIAWRNLRATWIYHSASKSQTEWKHVVLVLGTMAIVAPTIFFGAITAAQWRHPGASSHEVEGPVMMSLAALPIIMGLLTWIFPFSKRPATTDVAGVFD
jgi:hypothetical protein